MNFVCLSSDYDVALLKDLSVYEDKREQIVGEMSMCADRRRCRNGSPHHDRSQPGRPLHKEQ